LSGSLRFSFLWALVSFLFAGSGFRLPRVLGFHEGFQVIQASGPEDSVLLDPGVNGAQWLRIELIDAVATFSVLANQVGATQEAKMF
jgi:hypothetical protein